MKMTTSLALGSALLAFAATTYASPAYYERVTPPAAHTGSGTAFGSVNDTFTGTASLSKQCVFFPINISCTLEIDGVITAGSAPETLDLIIDDARSSGAGLCNSIGFSGFNWTASTPHAGLPSAYTDSTTIVEFDVSGVEVDTSCGVCSGADVSATFQNIGRGVFSFSGSIPGGTGPCSVSGALEAASGDSYRVWH